MKKTSKHIVGFRNILSSKMYRQKWKVFKHLQNMATGVDDTIANACSDHIQGLAAYRIQYGVKFALVQEIIKIKLRQ